MIGYVKGILEEIEEDCVIVDVNGLGIRILTGGALASQMLAPGSEVKIYTYTYVKEDAFQLYGFISKDELSLFKKLITVSGIGPKGALAILSTISPDDLRFAVLSDDVKLISSAPGIGAKTAQKLIIELKDRIKLSDAFEQALAHQESSTGMSVDFSARNEAVEALVALGYGNAEALRAVKNIENIEEKDTETILKEALKRLI